MDKFDIGIIGAGIAGSCLAILLAQQGKKIAIFEKESYPKHKVCGEFISLESYDFFKQLGLPLDQWNLPIIDKLKLTSKKGTIFNHTLKMGGFGLSRAKLDYELTQLYKGYNNITYYANTKVDNVVGDTIHFGDATIQAKLILGTHGKYSANYTPQSKVHQSKNYLGVKYHIKGNFSDDLISLHSFEGGYCGMSKIEENTYCLCYLIDSKLLKANNNDIHKLEKSILYKNQALKELFETALFVWENPLIISNVKFKKGRTRVNNILFAGDAAGSISPLSGNGMSIAARTALLLAETISKTENFKELALDYDKSWNNSFRQKVNSARILNSIMLHAATHNVVLKLFNSIPLLGSYVINSMQGKPFYVRK